MNTPERLEVPTDDGVAACWVHRPTGGGTHPGILMYPDAGSVRPVSQAMAARLAQAGYIVLLPNVFYRAGDYPPFDPMTMFSDPSERQRVMTLIRSLDLASAMRDARHYLGALSGQPDVRGARLGTVGYCLGGRLAFATAGTFPQRIAAAASIHGGGIASDAPDSPHLAAGQVEARLYFAIADNDGSCPPEQQGKLVAALAAAHLSFTVEHFKSAAHGFSMADFPVFDQAANERQWERVLELFRGALS